MATRLIVKAPEGNGYYTPQAIQRIQDHFADNPGMWGHAKVVEDPDHIPQVDKDGAFAVTCADHAVGLVATMLEQHYGLEILKVLESKRA